LNALNTEDFIPENMQAPAASPAPVNKTNWPLLGAVSAVAVILGLWGAQAILRSADPTPKRYSGQGWQYHFTEIELAPFESVDGRVDADASVKEKISDAGRDGWELVQALPRIPFGGGQPGHIYYDLIFKRPGEAYGPALQHELDFRSERAAKAIRAESAAQTVSLQKRIEAIQAGR
jgi:hypothetical protein